MLYSSSGVEWAAYSYLVISSSAFACDSEVIYCYQCNYLHLKTSIAAGIRGAPAAFLDTCHTFRHSHKVDFPCHHFYQ